jgi:hypothetical protein
MVVNGMPDTRRLATFDCGVCGIWTQGGDFLSVGRANQLGEKEHYNFVCFGCQQDQRRPLPARPGPVPDLSRPFRVARDLAGMYAAAGT